jgi:hypothetical protein
MNNASGEELHLTWNTDRREATPRFTSCPIAVLRLDVISAHHLATVLPARLGSMPLLPDKFSVF